MIRGLVLSFAVLTGFACAANAQYLMMPDSTNNRLVLFDPNNGSVVNPNYFALAGGTQIHALQVGNEIWVSEQTGDRVSRWDLFGTSLGAISGGLDNIRGMGLIGSTVYVTNAGTANGAPGNAVVMYDTSGNGLGSFSTVGLAPSPFGVLAYGRGMLVSSSSANDDIHEFDLAGNSQGTFHNSTSLNFVEQMNYAHDGNILAGAFSSPSGVYWLNYNTGEIVSSFAASGVRGVYQLGNGNVMWTNSSGAWVYDINSQQSTQVYAGGGRYIDFLVIPAPGSVVLLGLAGLVAFRRRRG